MSDSATGGVKRGTAINGVSRGGRLAQSTEIQPFAVDPCASLHKPPQEYIKHTSYPLCFTLRIINT